MTIQIRTLTGDDAGRFKALRLQALRECPTAFAASEEDEAAEPLEALAARIAPGAGRAIFGGFDGDALVAIVALQREARRKLAHTAHVWGVYVAPTARGGGLGGQLLSHTLDFAGLQLGVRQVTLGVHAANTAAIALYRKLGFVQFGLQPGFLLHDGQLHDELHMVCMLPTAGEAAVVDSRLAGLWQAFETMQPQAFIDQLEGLLASLPPGSAIAQFERACAQDSTGHPERAVPLYEAALAAGLAGLRRRRAVIQLASSLRNLGDAARAAQLLTAELDAPDDALSGAVRGFLALALADLGREREGLAHSLTALSAALPRYNKSLARYAAFFVTSAERRSENPASR